MAVGLVVGFLVGKMAAYNSLFGLVNYPSEYSGRYGIDKPCELIYSKRDLELELMEVYAVGPNVCQIDFGEKVDGYHKLYPSSCHRELPSDNPAIYPYELIEPFDIAFKSIGNSKLSVKSTGKPETIYTRCHLLRHDLDTTE